MNESLGYVANSRWRSWFYLLLGAVLLFFTGGKFFYAWAPWLAFPLILRFLRQQKAWLGLVIGALVFDAVTVSAYRGVVPLSGALYYIIMSGISLMSFLPFVADRMLSPRLRGFTSTLVFPAAWVGLEYLSSISSPFGSWGALGYSQYGFLPLLQFASVAGLWGIGFLVAWSAATVNWAWEKHFRPREIAGGAGVFLAVAVAVLIYGGVRLLLPAPRGEQIKAAAVLPPKAMTEAVQQLVAQRGREFGREEIMEATLGLPEAMLARSREAARAGARIVLWSEGAVPLRPEEEKAYLVQAAALARQEGIHLCLALAVMPPGYPRQAACKNKVVLLSPEGKALLTYLKARPVPGEPCLKGSGRLQATDTDLARLGSAICYDMDFPGLIRQAGRNGTDLMLVPSSDWREITTLHKRMAAFRAVENGFNLLRAANKGLSAGVDYRGATLATHDYWRDAEVSFMMAALPRRGTRTIYARIGDLPAWLAILGFLLLSGLAVLRKPGINKETKTGSVRFG